MLSPCSTLPAHTYVMVQSHGGSATEILPDSPPEHRFGSRRAGERDQSPRISETEGPAEMHPRRFELGFDPPLNRLDRHYDSIADKTLLPPKKSRRAVDHSAAALPWSLGCASRGLLRLHQWHVDQVLAQEPGLKLVGA
jgi:hypothetical protein